MEDRAVATALAAACGARIGSSGTWATALPIRSLQHGQLRVPGAANLGNTCFINALLQSLAACPGFTRHVSAVAGQTKIMAAPHDELVAQLAGLLLSLRAQRSRDALPTLSARGLHSALRQSAEPFRYGWLEQQDSDELLCVLLERVEACAQRLKRHARLGLRDALGGTRSLARPAPLGRCPLSGVMMSQLACCTCGTLSALQGTPVKALRLPLVNGAQAAVGSLEAALKLAFAQETVEDVQCAGLCGGERRSMFRKCSLGRAPETTLCVHLGRRHFDMRTGRMVKLWHHVSFPTHLDLAPYLFFRDGRPRGAADMESLLSNFAPLRPPASGSAIAAAMAMPRGAAVVFELRAVLVHHGGAEGGHFTAFRRLGAGKWAHVSDAAVRPAAEAQVLAAQAYMLLYERTGEGGVG